MVLLCQSKDYLLTRSTIGPGFASKGQPGMQTVARKTRDACDMLRPRDSPSPHHRARGDRRGPLIGARTSLASMSLTPVCNTHAAISLDTAAAAATPAGSGATVGMTQALRLATSLRTGGGDLCTTRASAAVQSKLAAIATLYRTSRSAATSNSSRCWRRSRAVRSTPPCAASHPRSALTAALPDLSSTINISGATQTTPTLRRSHSAARRRHRGSERRLRCRNLRFRAVGGELGCDLDRRLDHDRAGCTGPRRRQPRD